MRGIFRDLLSNYAQDVLDTERFTGDDTILTAVVTMVREVIHLWVMGATIPPLAQGGPITTHPLVPIINDFGAGSSQAKSLGRFKEIVIAQLDAHAEVAGLRSHTLAHNRIVRDDVALHQGDVDGSQILIRSHYASTLLCNNWSRSCTSRAIWYSTFHSIKSAVSGISPACQRRKNSSELS